MISIRKQIEESGHFASKFEALRHAYLELTAGLPETGKAADPELSARVRVLLEQAALAILYEASAADPS